MEQNRRDFLKGTAWMGLAAMAAGCMSKGMKLTGGCGAPMQGYADKPMETIRVGFVGLGSRGPSSARRVTLLPGVKIVALCDIDPARTAAANDWRVKNGYPKAREYTGTEGYKRMCAADDIDVIYSVTSWEAHTPINCCAMANGKHVFTEMPGALTVEDCWKQVEYSEKYRRHCMMLENCCYGEYEMLAFNLIKKGMLGEIVQAEVGYTHDQRALQYNPRDGVFWRIKRHQTHHGNYYPTHGLVPAGKCLDINRGDRFDYLVSMETKSASFEAYGAANFPKGDWRHDAKMVKGDINTCLLRTVNGKVLQLVHNVCTPTPYDRGNKYLGTKGTIRGIKDESYQICFETETGDKGAEKYFDAKRAQEVREAYKHPFWKTAGDIAKKVGGHGGMDFIMDLRWVYCLQNGLPMDTDVYDLATYSSIVELSERSVNAGSRPIEFPDYTRGGWKTAKPFTVDEFDISKFDFGSRGIGAASAQQTT